ncbi:hypothetical protein TVD_09045 [Thioalkalivibrio versutus]|uniref:Uncharacterized protein n=1 Tax=Thioalkalivibrio versutus TaxID=106634 RepID=A0A0G3G7M3_9GAMM|nr:hypothetical protein TVD_09045 [Thioalkalivibrio versutus]
MGLTPIQVDQGAGGEPLGSVFPDAEIDRAFQALDRDLSGYGVITELFAFGEHDAEDLQVFRTQQRCTF